MSIFSMYYYIKNAPHGGTSLQIGKNIDFKIIIQYQTQNACRNNNRNGVAYKPYDHIRIIKHVAHYFQQETAKNCNYNDEINIHHIHSCYTS